MKNTKTIKITRIDCEELQGLCLTPCPHGVPDTMAGSNGCGACPYHVRASQNPFIVECRYGEVNIDISDLTESDIWLIASSQGSTVFWCETHGLIISKDEKFTANPICESCHTKPQPVRNIYKLRLQCADYKTTRSIM